MEQRPEHNAPHLHALIDALRIRMADLQRQAWEAPAERQALLGAAFDALQQGLSDLASAESALQAERDEIARGLQEALRREQHGRAVAEAANVANTEFLATISHELRTPLNAILGWTQILRTGPVPNEASGRALASIERNARIQARLIEDLLDSSQIALGRLRLELAPVDLGSILAATIHVVEPTATAKQVTITSPASIDVFIVLGDGVRLQQVLWNLLANAVKFTSSGGGVDVRIDQVGKNVAIAIVDNGIGIEPSFLPHVFEPFRRAEKTATRRHGGLGLGLAIVRQLVEAHGGEVRAESAGPGAGASFIVTLPLSLRREERRAVPRLPFEAEGEYFEA